MLDFQREIVSYAKNATEQIYAQRLPYPGHDITHVFRVVSNIQKICSGESIDPFLPTLAGWLHDIGRIEEWETRDRAAREGRKDIRFYHAEASARMVPDVLHPFRDALGNTSIDAIAHAVGEHSKPNADNDDSLIILLKDADRLDGMGDIGITRTFQAQYHMSPYRLPNPFGEVDTRPEFIQYSSQATVLDGLFTNIEWYGMLRIVTAKAIGLPKVQRTIKFLYGLADDLGLPRDLVDENKIIKQVKINFPEAFV